ncbi:vacuolar protein sorting-associated protein [Anaeramoeba ignava]|uniref:Vacuolar protein sorting-associated protein n=1 Tax=Anaeramoeba ignava TaxID=1746090 RepID=A0A9Q0LBT7_ANAIG|nr:vacuolar protein sorting-associated protein [Anaeramoeba ignava]
MDIFQIKKLQNIQWLNQDETLSAVDSCEYFFVVGTSKGSIILLNQEGNLIEMVTRIHESAIKVVKIHKFKIISGATDGTIKIWDWFKNKTKEFGSKLDNNQSITSLAIPNDFMEEKHANYLYFGTSSGALVKRSGPSFFRKFNDNLIIQLGDRMPQSIEEFWFGFSSTKTQATFSIRSLELVNDLLFFSYGNSIMVYDLKRKKFVVQFEMKNLQNENENENENQNQNENENENIHKNLQKILPQFKIYHHWFIALINNIIYFCNINPDQEISIEKKYFSPIPVLSFGILNDVIVLSLLNNQNRGENKKRYIDFATLDINNLEIKATDYTSIPCKNEDSSIAFINDSITSLKAPENTFLIKKSEEKGNRFSWILCFETNLLLIRPITASEKILYYIQSAKFTKAMDLCTRFNRRKELIEVANEYACFLWKTETQQQKAMAVWAEYCLPQASREYWNIFAERLTKNNRLHLLEPYLPFNNKQLLQEKYYNIILEYYLENSLLKTFLKCVDHWPILYSIEEITNLLCQKIIELRTKNGNKISNQNHLIQQDEDEKSIRHLFNACFKLCIYQAMHIDALKCLIELEDPKVMEYFEENSLWKYFYLNINNIIQFEQLSFEIFSFQYKRTQLIQLLKKNRGNFHNLLSSNPNVMELVEIERSALLLKLIEIDKEKIFSFISIYFSEKEQIESIKKLLKNHSDLQKEFLIHFENYKKNNNNNSNNYKNNKNDIILQENETKIK